MEGEIKANVEDYQGSKLSPNYPWRIALSVENKKGKTKKFFVHLVRLQHLTCCGVHPSWLSRPHTAHRTRQGDRRFVSCSSTGMIQCIVSLCRAKTSLKRRK